MGTPESGPSDEGQMAGRAGAVRKWRKRGIETRPTIASGQEPLQAGRYRCRGSPLCKGTDRAATA